MDLSKLFTIYPIFISLYLSVSFSLCFSCFSSSIFCCLHFYFSFYSLPLLLSPRKTCSSSTLLLRILIETIRLKADLHMSVQNLFCFNFLPLQLNAASRLQTEANINTKSHEILMRKTQRKGTALTTSLSTLRPRSVNCFTPQILQKDLGSKNDTEFTISYKIHDSVFRLCFSLYYLFLSIFSIIHRFHVALLIFQCVHTMERLFVIIVYNMYVQ